MSASSKTTPILMSSSNPDGWKLDELVSVLQAEIEAAGKKIENDTSVEAAYVRHNNARILGLLDTVNTLWRASHIVLDAKAPDQGPLGQPRIGQKERSADVPEQDSSVDPLRHMRECFIDPPVTVVVSTCGHGKVPTCPGTHIFPNGESEVVIDVSEDGSWISLESYAGGSHPLGLWGELTLAFYSPTGEILKRCQYAVNEQLRVPYRFNKAEMVAQFHPIRKDKTI